MYERSACQISRSLISFSVNQDGFFTLLKYLRANHSIIPLPACLCLIYHPFNNVCPVLRSSYFFYINMKWNQLFSTPESFVSHSSPNWLGWMHAASGHWAPAFKLFDAFRTKQTWRVDASGDSKHVRNVTLCRVDMANNWNQMVLVHIQLSSNVMITGRPTAAIFWQFCSVIRVPVDFLAFHSHHLPPLAL